VGTTEAQLRRDAERDRERMGETLDAIGDRLSPERVVERRKAAVGQGFRRMREAVMGSPGYVEPATQRARQGAQNAASTAADAAREGAQNVASTAADAARSAAENMRQAPQMLADQTRGNPLAVGVIAFGAGMLVATLFPKTETEQQLIGDARPTIDRAKEELQGTGRELAADMRDHAKDAAQQVGEAGKEAATNVTEQTKSSAQEVAQQAKGQAQS
jgi:hypothetical protein